MPHHIMKKNYCSSIITDPTIKITKGNINSKPAIQTPPRTTSLHFKEILSQSSSHSPILLSFFEDISLVEDVDMSSGSNSRGTSIIDDNKTTLGNASKIISNTSGLPALSSSAASLENTSTVTMVQESQMSKSGAFKESNSIDASTDNGAKKISLHDGLKFSSKNIDSTIHISKPSKLIYHTFGDSKEDLFYYDIRVRQLEFSNLHHNSMAATTTVIGFDEAYPGLLLERPSLGRLGY